MEPVGGGTRVPGVGALLLQALDTYIDLRLQNIFICGHGPTAGFLPPTWQGGGRVGNRKTHKDKGTLLGRRSPWGGAVHTQVSRQKHPRASLCQELGTPKQRTESLPSV